MIDDYLCTKLHSILIVVLLGYSPIGSSVLHCMSTMIRALSYMKKESAKPGRNCRPTFGMKKLFTTRAL